MCRVDMDSSNKYERNARIVVDVIAKILTSKLQI